MRAYSSIVRLIAVALPFISLIAIIPAAGEGNASTSVIGKVKEIRSGTLERQERDLWKPLAAGAVIFSNDRIRTAAGSTAVLSLNEVGSVLIGPGTEYYLGDPSRGFKSLLKRGYLWFTTTLKPGASMSIATASAVAGVRGTKFSVIQDAEGMNVCTCKGAVQVTLKDGKSVAIARGMYGNISAAGKMGAPEKGKPHLERIWKEKPARYASCLECHRKGKKIIDLS